VTAVVVPLACKPVPDFGQPSFPYPQKHQTARAFISAGFLRLQGQAPENPLKLGVSAHSGCSEPAFALPRAIAPHRDALEIDRPSAY
jgi:hypothetical protein